MKSLKFTSLLILLLLVNIFANTPIPLSLIRIDLSEQSNAIQIENLEIQVVYEVAQVVLLKANQNQIDILTKTGVEFEILDQNIAYNTYHLANIQNLSSNDQLRYKSVGSINNYLILKNIDQEIEKDLSGRIHLSKLDINSTKSFNYNHYIFTHTGTDTEPLITEVIEDINRDSVEFFINTLQQFGTRFMLAPNRFEVSKWIYDQFIRFGFTEVEYDTFRAHTSISYEFVNEDTITVQRNVVATLPGNGDPEAVFIVCGHYDSFNSGMDPFQYAPGADDDASGTAAVLEMARVFMENNITPRRTIKFIALGAEELMYFGDGGSEHYAALSDSLDTDIRMVINHDMISHTYQTLTNSTINVNHHYTADHFADLALENIAKYTEINGALDDYYGADLGPFITHGYTGIYFEESEFSPFYHSSDDIIDNYSMEFCTEVIKASCATLIDCSTIPTSLKDFHIADRGEGTSFLLNWDQSIDYNFDHFKIYIGEESGIYTREETTIDTSYLIDQLIPGTEYFIGISVVDSDGYESLIREQPYIPFYFSRDQGILVIDETADGDGSLAIPNDEQIDTYYKRLLDRFDITEWDLIDNQGISLTDFGAYSTIIWHAEELYNPTTLNLILNELGRFLSAGGNLIYVGYTPCQVIEGTFGYPASFSRGDFVYDYLKISSTNKGFGTKFSGATANGSDYFDIHVDSLKTEHTSTRQLSNIESIEATERGSNILLFDSNFDSSSAQGRMIGEPVGVEYIGEDFKTVTLTFPLYYMEEDKAKELLEYIIGEKFSEPLSVPELAEDVPQNFALHQNYPNPFNPTTIINYELPITNDVVLSIYNLLGQKVANLVSETQQVGYHFVQWDASGFASGVYYYRLETKSGFIQTKKMILLR